MPAHTAAAGDATAIQAPLLPLSTTAAAAAIIKDR